MTSIVLAHVPTPGDWTDHAACRGHDPNKFFPSRGTPVSSAIRNLCKGCPVRTDCLEFGIRWPVLGIWGGKAVRERRCLRLQRLLEAEAA